MKVISSWVDRGYHDCAHVADYYVMLHYNAWLPGLFEGLIMYRRRAEMYKDWCFWDYPDDYISCLQYKVVHR